MSKMVIADAIYLLYSCYIHRGKLGKPELYESGGVSALNCLGPSFCDKV